MISEKHNLSGLNFGGNPSSPSSYVRKRAGGRNEGQLNEEMLKRKALGDIANGGEMHYKGIGNLPQSEVGNLVGAPERMGEADQDMPVAGNGNIVPETKKIDPRLARLMAQRYR